MASASNHLMWAFVEEAVIQDRGSDEEQSLNDIVRSYLHRRGLADTLATFESELHERSAPLAQSPPPNAVVGMAPSGRSVAERKHAQLLCLRGEFEAAAAMVPADSPLHVELLSLEALRCEDQLAGMAYATNKIAPLVPLSADPQHAHSIYLQTVTSLLNNRNKEDFAAQTENVSLIAHRVNEDLLSNRAPSALNVLVSWALWQEHTLTRKRE